MLQQFFATILTGFAIITGTIAHDIVQLPTNVSELLFSNSATSLPYSRHAHNPQPAAAAAAQSTKREIKQPASSPTPTPHDLTVSPFAVATNAPSPLGHVLGASTQQPASSDV